MFAPVGDGQRSRRGSDGVRLAVAVIALGCSLLLIRFDSRMDRAITEVIHPPPWSIDWLVTVVYQAGSFGVVLVLVTLALVARRWEIARDIAVSAAGAAAVGGILILFLGSRGGRPAGIVIHGYYLSFPVLQIAVFAAVATAALPYLARGVQRLIEVFIALVALACAVGGHGLPLNVGGSLAIGWGVTAAVRLVFGSPLGLPSAGDVRLLLEELGIGTSYVRPAARQVWGVAKYEASEVGGADGPVLNRSLHGRGELLADVRQRAARAASVEVPKLAEPHRVSWPTLIMMAGLLIGGWALVDVLLNVSKSFDTVIGADWLWVITAFVLAQLAYLALGLQNVGSVAGPLPFGRAVGVEVANSFSALAGGTPAVLATRMRFMQQQGYDASVALSSAAIMTTASWIAILVLFLVSLPFAWGSIHLKVTPQAGLDPKLVWIALAVLVAIALVAGLAMAVPRLRRLAAVQVRPRVHQVWDNLRQVAISPRKLVLLASGSFARQLLVAMTLSVSLRALGDHLWLPVLIVIITLAGIIGGVSPSPGGIGVVEAGMILGLTAAGVAEADATTAVFIQRLFTSYLPPIWGWIVLVWMRKKDYL